MRGSVEETLNELLEAEAEKLTQAARYERNEQRQGYRSGHYSRNLTTTSGDVTLKVPKLKGISFETAIIERYRRRESSVEEALIEMYLADVSVRRVEDITEALWGSKVSPATISELNKKAYVHIEDWRNRPLQGGRYPYVYVDGIYLRRNWGGEFENVAILVAIAVNGDGYREVLGAAEGMKEDKASWVSFFQWLRSRGLDGVKLVVGDKCRTCAACFGMLEAVGEVFPEAKYQRCIVHFYRNVFSVTPRSKVKLVAKMLKAIHAQESKKAAREKSKAVMEELRSMKLKEAPIMFEALRPKPWVSMRVKNFPLMDMRLFSVLLFALFMASEISQHFRFNRFFLPECIDKSVPVNGSGLQADYHIAELHGAQCRHNFSLTTV